MIRLVEYFSALCFGRSDVKVEALPSGLSLSQAATFSFNLIIVP